MDDEHLAVLMERAARVTERLGRYGMRASLAAHKTEDGRYHTDWRMDALTGLALCEMLTAWMARGEELGLVDTEDPPVIAPGPRGIQ